MVKLLCEKCKSFPICSAKGDYAVTQARINEVLNLSEHFNKAELSCEYFTSKDPIFPCGHV